MDRVVVDHINGDTLDNRMENLHVVHVAPRNVRERPRVWIVRYRARDGKCHSRMFSVAKYGEHAAQALAITWQRMHTARGQYATVVRAGPQ